MKAFIQEIAGRIGFSATGISAAVPAGNFAHLQDAIASGRVGDMVWLARDPERRCDPAAFLPRAKSVICCALAYGERGIEGGKVACDERRARFARGAEYHEAVRTRLERLWAKIQERFPSARAKLCIDTSPLLEKALAQRAGLGWIGKHTILLSERLGSWFVLGEIVTDLELEPDPPCADRCGDCRACMEACPTGALIAPRVLDARRCIAYLTIENKGPIPEVMHPFVPEGAYGCDRCQEACPYNGLTG